MATHSAIVSPPGFDYVISNPPYVRTHNLEESVRKNTTNFEFLAGATDLYVLFYEVAIRLAEKRGRVSFIAPNSWMKNTSQSVFRKYLAQSQTIVKVIDFGSSQVFPGADTYTCIVQLSKTPHETFQYVRAESDLEEVFATNVAYDTFPTDGASFVFAPPDQQHIITKTLRKDGAKFSEFCKIQNAVCTLGNKYFLLRGKEATDQKLLKQAYIHPAVKASTYKGGATDYIIFPYSREENTNIYKGITEKVLQTSAIPVYERLLKNKEALQQRDRDKGALWFWYGRSQAIQESGKRKLVFSHIISPDQEKIRAHIISENTIVYAGLFITEHENTTSEQTTSVTLEEVAKIIESEEFLQYCRIFGKDMGGGYKAVSSPVVKNYRP